MSYTPTTWKPGDVVSSVKLNKLENGLATAAAGVDVLAGDVGPWYFAKQFENQRYPWIQFNSLPEKIFIRILEPLNAIGVSVFGSTDGFSTQQTLLFSKPALECVATIDPGNYTSFRVTVTLPEYTSGSYRAIIHGFDDHSISQEIIGINDKIAGINSFDAELFVPDAVMTGTNYSGFYVNTTVISSISNPVFNVRAYAVEKGKTYYLYGEGISLNAPLPLCGFGTETVAANAIVKEVILEATTTDADYAARYTPTEDGYLYVAWVTGKKELSIFSTKIVSDAFIDEFPRIPVKIQLFGDSITDNLWGDKVTWANYIQKDLPEYAVTVVNDAVGGSGIGHGKSSGTTPAHQDDDYNHVYDLVTDGVTLQTDANYIVILAGTNNWASGTDLGDMSSSGYSTVYGALKGIVEYISNHSAATVFLCTLPQRYNTTDQSRQTNAYGEPLNDDGVTLAEYCEAFRKVAAFYGMPCIHLNEDLGWNRLNISNFSGDGLHPNAKGDKMLAAFICSEIRKHIGKVFY